MPKKFALHALGKKLEAPALLYKSLAWYWGSQIFTLAGEYRKATANDEIIPELRWLAEANDEINHIIGLEKPRSIALRFNQARDGYLYCFARNHETSINSPWDLAATIEDMAESRRNWVPPIRSVSRPEDLSERQNDILNALRRDAKDKRRESMAKRERILDIEYVLAEVHPMQKLCMDQIDKQTGFSTEEIIAGGIGLTVGDLDQLMPQEVQDNILGDIRLQHQYTADKKPLEDKVVSTGLLRNYARAIQILEDNMYNPQRKSELESVHYLTIQSWKQLYRLRRPQASRSPQKGVSA